ncbi:tetratricopeptide repeat protein [Bacteroidota bacterium]
MTDNLHTIFSTSGCPSEEELQHYLQGALSDEARHRIEAHLADCEMCSDELEGLSLLKDPGKLPGIVEELEERMASKQPRILRMNPRIFLAAAAVVILLIGTLFVYQFILPPQQKPLLTEQQPIPNTKEETEVKTPVEEEEPSESTASITSSETEISAASNIAELVSEPPATSEEAAAEETPLGDSQGEGQPAAAKISANDSTTAGPVSVEEVKRMKSNAMGGVSSQLIEVNFMALAMEQLEKKNFPESARLFQDVIGQDSGNYKAMYHLAVCYMEMDKQKKALRVLEKVVEDPDSTFYQKAIDLVAKIKEN